MLKSSDIAYVFLFGTGTHLEFVAYVALFVPMCSPGCAQEVVPRTGNFQNISMWLFQSKTENAIDVIMN